MRDWERPDQPLFKMDNFSESFGMSYNKERKGQSGGFEMSTLLLCKQDHHLMITAESKKVRVWDMRAPLQKSLKNRSVMTIGHDEIPMPKTRSIMADSKNDLTSKSFEMHYQPV